MDKLVLNKKTKAVEIEKMIGKNYRAVTKEANRAKTPLRSKKLVT